LGRVGFRAEPASRALLAEAVAGAGVGQRVIEGIDLRERGRRLRAVAGVLRREREALAAGICEDVGKPIGMARAEVERSALLLEAVAELGERTVMESRSGAERGYRHRPLGVVAAITPWNNPLVIPIGKIAPALMYGNGVVWKPALPGTRVAQRVMALLEEGWAAGARAVRLCAGDAGVARWLAEQQGVEGVTLSGSEQAGYALQEICTDRHVPFQGELGGNNAAIVWEVERNQLAGIAREIALGAFGFAGQRCTANRRVIVAVREVREMVELLASETRKLVWGDPREEGTVVGPVISSEKREQMMALLQRARATGLEVLQPHVDGGLEGRGNKEGAYVAPAIVVSGDAGEEVVQEESFGPVLVVQAAETFEEAIALCNGVRQGLAAALFSQNAERQGQFLAAARAGILKLNQSTVDADACSPFGGWKASGAGPAEHGASDREFFTRVQTIYGKQPEV
jgi:acyl-CoA reductase-like NAD-dependent aldehyde dehydrogenase